MTKKINIKYKIEKRAYDALKRGGENFRIGCSGEYGVDCGGSAVHTSLQEVEDEIRNLKEFVGSSDASGFYVVIDDDEYDEQPHEWLYCEVQS